MTADGALSIAQEAIRVALFVGAPVLGFGLIAGLLVSLFQATTQINESSLQFLPKVLAALVGLVVFGPWMLTELLDFTRTIFAMLPQMAR